MQALYKDGVRRSKRNDADGRDRYRPPNRVTNRYKHTPDKSLAAERVAVANNASTTCSDDDSTDGVQKSQAAPRTRNSGQRVVLLSAEGAEIKFWKHSNNRIQCNKFWDAAHHLEPSETFTVAKSLWL